MHRRRCWNRLFFAGVGRGAVEGSRGRVHPLRSEHLFSGKTCTRARLSDPSTGPLTGPGGRARKGHNHMSAVGVGGSCKWVRTPPPHPCKTDFPLTDLRPCEALPSAFS